MNYLIIIILSINLAGASQVVIPPQDENHQGHIKDFEEIKKKNKQEHLKRQNRGQNKIKDASKLEKRTEDKVLHR